MSRFGIEQELRPLRTKLRFPSHRARNFPEQLEAITVEVSVLSYNAVLPIEHELRNKRNEFHRAHEYGPIESRTHYAVDEQTSLVKSRKS